MENKRPALKDILKDRNALYNTLGVEYLVAAVLLSTFGGETGSLTALIILTPLVGAGLLLGAKSEPKQ